MYISISYEHHEWYVIACKELHCPGSNIFICFFNQISCCLGEVSLATAAWVAVGEIFLWNNPADREALELSREGGGPLNNL